MPALLMEMSRVLLSPRSLAAAAWMLGIKLRHFEVGDVGEGCWRRGREEDQFRIWVAIITDISSKPDEADDEAWLALMNDHAVGVHIRDCKRQDQRADSWTESTRKS